jgi:ribosomal protein S12 methylthiotransferase accessory factor
MPTGTSLRSIHVNRGYEALAYQTNSASRASIEDMISLYNATGGPVRKVASYLGPGGGFHVNVGHCAHYELDHVIQKMTGMPSLDTGARNTLFGGGKGYSLNDMMLSSLGEGVERALGALAYFLGRAEPIFGTRRELVGKGYSCLSPEECPLFAPEQYETPGFMYERFTNDVMLGWLKGERLISGDEVWVPAQLVELLHLGPPSEGSVGYSQSGGLSCHIDRDHALFHGITELFERDAVNLRWYLKIPPDEIDLDQTPVDPETAALIADLQGQPGRMRYLHHSLDIPEIPVITAIRLDPWLRSFSYSAGGGVDTDSETSLLKALTEFGQSERTIRMAVLSPQRAVSGAVDEMFGVEADAPLDRLTLFVQVIGYYGHPANHHKLDWYLDHNPALALSAMPHVDPSTSMSQRLTDLKTVLERHEIDPIIFDFSPPDTDQLVLFKAYIPEITQPFLQSRPMLGHPRFATVAASHGGNDNLEYQDLNPDPLPYP